MTNNTTILLVDDEVEIRQLVAIYLQNEGYRLLEASNGVEALEWVQKEEIDLVVLDLMMPLKDGITTCQEIRQTHTMPIIMLTAKTEEIHKIQGLSIGADDYITKPFHPLELVARIKSQLRRYQTYGTKPGNLSELVLGELTVYLDQHEVYRGQQKIDLSPKEFAILTLLAENPGKVYSLEKIYEKVWKEDFIPSYNTVMVHIRKLREKIEPDPKKPIYIQTVWGVGYKLGITPPKRS
ncbi:response regulator transcription factor [Risungbinella massiliensis]|uniref:response regulator transcription factor n=1 Tax=Risungbinella massiliensis TaxID=1329796 RepID=UPI0005CC7158|nr:response regulator transcription factor [Risungbinella massiliensis]